MGRKKIYDDFESLLGDLQCHLIDVADEVADEMKNIEVEVINETVYNAYNSSIDRRMEKGGLSDKSNMEEDIDLIKDGVSIGVINTTKGNDEYSYADGYTSGFIADIIEEGHGYGYGLDEYIGAREFQETTQNYIDHTNRIDNVVEKSLNKKGW